VTKATDIGERDAAKEMSAGLAGAHLRLSVLTRTTTQGASSPKLRRKDSKFRSKAGQAVYSLRKSIVEPVFVKTKGARRFDHFRLRVLEKVNGEWALMATTHNLLKLFRASLATA
jgi:hypothetical protein